MLTSNESSVFIGYRVCIDPKVVKGNQQGEFIDSLLPLELADKSPFIARLLAISFVQAHPFVYVGGCLHRLVVWLIDYETGNEYLIYSGKKPSIRMLKNLEIEFLLYLRNGYPYYGWQLVTDRKGNAYRVITTEDWNLGYEQTK